MSARNRASGEDDTAGVSGNIDVSREAVEAHVAFLRSHSNLTTADMLRALLDRAEKAERKSERKHAALIWARDAIDQRVYSHTYRQVLIALVYDGGRDSAAIACTATHDREQAERGKG